MLVLVLVIEGLALMTQQRGYLVIGMEVHRPSVRPL